jgi:hypothetical protein
LGDSQPTESQAEPINNAEVDKWKSDFLDWCGSVSKKLLKLKMDRLRELIEKLGEHK